MNPKMYYSCLPKDMSGSVSKNRFRLELLWGVNKFIDLLIEENDFTMVFDCVCDIEVHFADKFDFYQVKSTRGNSFTTKKLIKKQGTESILGKLYKLVSTEDANVNLFIVSNVKHYSIHNETLMCSFSELPEVERKIIVEALCEELGKSNIDLDKIFYIRTHMNLENPENEVRGKLVATFEKIKGCEPSNPNALYRLILDTVTTRANYEFKDEEYNGILKNKGICRREFDELLEMHSTNSNTGVEQARKYIENKDNILLKRKYYEALSTIVQKMISMLKLKDVENKVNVFLNGLLNEYTENVTEKEIIEKLDLVFGSMITNDVTELEKELYFVIVLNKWMNGVYTNENGV